MLRLFRKLVTRHSVLVALATAGPALAQQAPPRAAILLPPRPLEPGEAPPVARAAMDDLAPLATTPVTRPNSPPARPAGPGPAWLYDSNVQPAGAQGSLRPPARVAPAADPYAPAPVPAREQPSAVSKGLDRIKTFVGGDRPEPGMFPPAGREQPTPAAPFRGTGPNGAPVYAGPPAWRWYGYGTVTPGANPLAPAGQYPRASANWYAVTSATPGAVPVPVMNPMRPTPGSEPPGYVAEPAVRTPRQPAPAYPNPAVYPPPGMTPPPANETKFGPAGGAAESSKFQPTAATGAAPKRLPPPAAPPRTAATAPPAPVGVPTLAAPPAASRPVIASAEPTADPLPVRPVEPVVSLPPIPVVPSEPLVKSEPIGLGPKALADAAVSGVPPAVAPADTAAPVAPPLTTAKPVDPPPAAQAPPVAPAQGGDDVNWQSTPQKLVPLETWGPATGTAPPAPRPEPPADRGWQPGAGAAPARPVARGQAPEHDPAGDLIRSMCRGRAKEPDIRATGDRRLTVCFEVRTEPEANRLVKEICARPELRPYAIDFCVLVK